MLFTGERFCTTKRDRHIGIYSFLWLEGATVTIFWGWSKVGDQPIFVKKNNLHIHFRRALKDVIQVGLGDDSTNIQQFNIH